MQSDLSQIQAFHVKLSGSADLVTDFGLPIERSDLYNALLNA